MYGPSGIRSFGHLVPMNPAFTPSLEIEGRSLSKQSLLRPTIPIIDQSQPQRGAFASARAHSTNASHHAQARKKGRTRMEEGGDAEEEERDGDGGCIEKEGGHDFFH